MIKGLVGWLLVTGVGCALGKPAAVPLYADAATHRLPPERIATLRGPIHTVDGRDVSKQGRTFELTPGCHVVVMSNNIGAAGPSMDGAWAATVPRLTVAFRMMPTHRYSIEFDTPDSSAPVGRFTIMAREQLPNGEKRGVPFARSDADVQDCQHWAQQHGY